MKVDWWTIKIKWDTGEEEYIEDIPYSVAKHVDNWLNQVEENKTNE